jgi:Methyltransferase domain
VTARIRLFYRLLAVVSPVTRRDRMNHLRSLDLRPGTKVIDLGGVCEIWQLMDTPLDITIVNLPGVDVQRPRVTRHNFRFVEGDGTNLSSYSDNEFDLVFSNSVIEHVGGQDRQIAFAREVRRLAPSYYVQTPSIWFPLEAHSGVPFWWALPQAVRRRLIDRWRAKLPAWAEMIEGTTVITRKRLQSYFPDGSIITERFAGFPKSYTVFRSTAR